MGVDVRGAAGDVTVSALHARLHRPVIWGPLVESGTPSAPSSPPIHLPAGTATVLLAESTWSAPLSEDDPAAIGLAAAQCSRLLAGAAGRHGGVSPEKPRDGSLVAVFGRASDALAAAIDAQTALSMQAWPTAEPLRVRIALHTAEAQARDQGNYFGQAVERCARLRAIAHGGQTVLSRSAHDLVVDRLPAGVELVDLGVHRLRDLGRPEQVFGLSAGALESEFPPLLSLDTWPNNLPEQFTSFVGREWELTELRRQLSSSRLLVLTGAGGCGKTRLALQAAADCLELSPDGAWSVELAPLADGELIAAALADVLGVRGQPGRPLLETIVDRLRGTRTLVLLDNCEHVLEAAADVCETLLRGCPQLVVLATSRAPLGVAGESDWRVPPLSLPPQREPEPVEALAPSDAVRLFIDRAASVRPNFKASSANAPAIAQICHDLDGIPLAIELAAARVRVLSPEQIAAGLDDRFRLLTGGARGAMPRQQTLRASVDWSHELLSGEERLLFRRLAVFTGSFSLDAVEQVCGGDGLRGDAVLDLLTSLVDKSLVLADEHRGMVRYGMLETVREYALDLVGERGELAALRERHLAFFLAFAERAAPELVSPNQRDWLEQLDPEAANFAAAIAHATETDPQRALALCAALTWWWMGGRVVAGELAHGRVLAGADAQPSALRARVTWGRALIARHAGEYAASFAYAQEALTMAEAVADRSTMARAMWSMSAIQLYPDPVGSRPRLERAIELGGELGDDWVRAHAVSALAYSYLFTDEIDQGERLFRDGLPVSEQFGAESLMWYWLGLAWGPTFRAQPGPCFEFGERAVAAAREVGDPVPEALAHHFMAALETAQGRPEAALARLQESEARVIASGAAMALPPTRIPMASALAALGELDRAREMLEEVVAGGADQGYNLALAMAGLASVLRILGDADSARARAEQALEISERIRSRNLLSASREVLGRLAAARGNWGEAEGLLHAALADRAEAGLLLFLPQTLDALAQVAAGLDSHAEAARLLGAAHRARGELGLMRSPPDGPAFAALEQTLAELLGTEAHEAAQAEGASMTIDEAVAWSRRARGRRKRPAGGWESLTPTESQVVTLVSEGLTNPEIAERMFISRATVKVHLAHVFQKLGVRTRAELAAQAIRRGG
jgi:predicted ATPase/DNA-binding CsgD family transcriptional regulator